MDAEEFSLVPHCSKIYISTHSDSFKLGNDIVCSNWPDYSLHQKNHYFCIQNPSLRWEKPVVPLEHI